MVSFSYESIMAVVVPYLKILVWAVVALGTSAGLGYLLFVVMRRRRWKINVWEQKSNGKMYLVEVDTLIARKFNKGKQTMYLLKKNRCETIPPPDECVDRVGKKETANYLRILEDYIPLSREVNISDKKTLIAKVKEAVLDIRRITAGQVENNYIFVPLSRAIVGNLNFTPIPYDVNMMRINALDNREKLYADSKGFWEKYGSMITVGIIVVLIIVVMYFSYDYSSKVLTQSFAAADKVGKPLADLVSKLGVG